MNYDEKCQLLIIGDATVGKTSLLFSYAENKFSPTYLATVGIDFFTKDETINNKIIRVKIWDTAGQERYKSLTNAFFRNVQGIILVYDVTNIESFENLKYWIQSIKQNLGSDGDTIKKIIIGNKLDLDREIKQDVAEEFAKEYKIPYFEGSAKNNQGISESIKYLVNEVLKAQFAQNSKESLRVSKQSKESNSDSGCKC
jgi:small GTP-binding protein